MEPAGRVFDGVLPLVWADFERFEILDASLRAHVPALATLWIVVPDEEYSCLNARIARRGVIVLRESVVIPELAPIRQLAAASGRRILGWYVQQLIKLSIADWISTDFYLTLDADVICLRPTRYQDLIHGNRAITRVNYPDIHPDWYAWAERVLGYSRSGLTHGVTPALLNRDGVRRLQTFLADRAHSDSRGQGIGPTLGTMNWRIFLLASIPWTEYALYYTFLEHEHLLECFHELAYGNVLYDRKKSLWQTCDIPAWGKDLHQGLPDSCYFIVAQSKTNVPPTLVRQRLFEAGHRF